MIFLKIIIIINYFENHILVYSGNICGSSFLQVKPDFYFDGLLWRSFSFSVYLMVGFSQMKRHEAAEVTLRAELKTQWVSREFELVYQIHSHRDTQNM